MGKAKKATREHYGWLWSSCWSNRQYELRNLKRDSLELDSDVRERLMEIQLGDSNDHNRELAADILRRVK